MSRQSLAALRQTVTVDWPRAAEQQARMALLKIAREGHAKTLAEQARRAGIAPDFEAFANQPGNSNLDSVKLPGPIIYRYDYRREIVAVALEALRRASPRKSGRYAESHTIYLNGIAVDRLPARLNRGDEIWISNPVPYARRLEVGKTKAGRDFVIRVKPRIYESVVKAPVNLRGRYGNAAKVEFDYIDIPGAWVIKGRLTSHYQTRGKSGKGELRQRKRQQSRRIGQKIRAPAIIISLHS